MRTQNEKLRLARTAVLEAIRTEVDGARVESFMKAFDTLVESLNLPDREDSTLTRPGLGPKRPARKSVKVGPGFWGVVTPTPPEGLRPLTMPEPNEDDAEDARMLAEVMKPV